jgi:hypothetical protein
MERSQAELEFIDVDDDTAENREVADLADARSRSPRSQDRDLDQLIEDCGYDPAEFLPA